MSSQGTCCGNGGEEGEEDRGVNFCRLLVHREDRTSSTVLKSIAIQHVIADLQNRLLVCLRFVYVQRSR
jgi:hypothetical protein